MFSLIIKSIFILTSLPVFFQTACLNEATYFKLEEFNYPYSLGPEITAESALAIDLEEGKTCFSKNEKKILPIASITKLMTGLVFLEHNNQDWEKYIEIKKEDMIVNSVSKNDLEPATLRLKSGEKIKIIDLFSAGLIRSGNDAMKVLARIIESESEKNFIELMNKKALELGMKNTHFTDPTGLDVNNKSTAEDIVKLVLEALKREEISRVLDKSVYDFSVINRGGIIEYYRVWNTNKLLGNFINLKGAKTGYLDESGYCFAGLSNYQEKQLVIVILNSKSDKDRFQEAKSLIWWSRNNCQK